MIARCTVLLALAVSAALAQTDGSSIEQTTRACLDRAGTPAAMAECTAKAAELWDTEVARSIDELGALLSAESRQALKSAQADWLRFRRSEAKSIAAIYGTLNSPAAAVIAAEDSMEIARDRALKLKKYIDLLKETRP